MRRKRCQLQRRVSRPQKKIFLNFNTVGMFFKYVWHAHNVIDVFGILAQLCFSDVCKESVASCCCDACGALWWCVAYLENAPLIKCGEIFLICGVFGVCKVYDVCKESVASCSDACGALWRRLVPLVQQTVFSWRSALAKATPPCVHCVNSCETPGGEHLEVSGVWNTCLEVWPAKGETLGGVNIWRRWPPCHVSILLDLSLRQILGLLWTSDHFLLVF